MNRQRRAIAVFLAFVLALSVSSESGCVNAFRFPDELILTAVNGITDYSRNQFDKVHAPEAFEEYIDSMPRNISQVDIGALVAAFGTQLSERTDVIDAELRDMVRAYTSECTPRAEDTTPFSHFRNMAYDGMRVVGPAGAEFTGRAECSLNAVTHVPNETLPLVSENDYTSWAIASDASDADLTWTANEAIAPVTRLDTAVMWRRVYDVETGAVAMAPALVDPGAFHDARESAAFINGASAVLPRAAAIIVDPFINNDYSMKDLPRLYSNMFHLARTVLMSLGDADGMTIHSTDGRYVGDNTYLDIADAKHTGITRGLHPAVWYRRMDMLQKLQAYFTDVAADGHTAVANGLQLGQSGTMYTRNMMAAIVRAVDSIKHSISASDASTATRYVLKPEAPAYLYILTTVPQVDTTFGYDLRKLLLDSGVGIIPVFIDVRTTLPTSTWSTWETVKGYFSTTDSQWTRAMCDVQARTVTPDLMYNYQIDPFIDTAVEYTARTTEYLQYIVPTKAHVVNVDAVHGEALFNVLVELVVSASETARALAVAADPAAADVPVVRLEVALDEKTERQVMEISSPVFMGTRLDAVASVAVDLEQFVFFIDYEKVETTGYPFNPQAAIYDANGRLFYNSMLDSTHLTDQDSLDLLDPEEIEGWVGGGFAEALASAADGQYGSHTVEVARQLSGQSYTTVRARYIFMPIGALLLVTSWPEHFHTRVNLRPDLLTMEWCPETYSGDLKALLGEYKGKACYDPQVFAMTSLAKTSSVPTDATEYYSLMGLDNDMLGTTYSSILPRFGALEPENRAAKLADVTWDSVQPFIQYNNKTAFATPERSLDWIMTDKAVGEMQAVSILGAAWRHAFVADATMVDRVKYINAITIDDSYTYAPNNDFLTSLGVTKYAAVVTKTYFHGPFASEELLFTDPYSALTSSGRDVLVNIGMRVNLNDRGYGRPWVSASYELSLAEATADVFGPTSCGTVRLVDGENYFIDCFVLTQTAHVSMQNDVDVLNKGILLADDGIIKLSDSYPALFDFLTRNGVYVKENVIDFASLTRTEAFKLAPSFGTTRKMIVDGELVSANCVVGTQMREDEFEVIRIGDSTKLNRHVAACRLPDHDTLFVLTENVTVSDERFVSQAFAANDVTLKSTPIFNVVLDTITPEFGSAEPSTVDPSVFKKTWGIQTDATCTLSKRTAPVELVVSALLMAGTAAFGVFAVFSRVFMLARSAYRLKSGERY